MSRKWERMVQKNTKVTNKHRVSQGKSTLSEVGKPKVDRHLGRNIVFPLLFAGVSVFFSIAFIGIPGQSTGMYWFTVISYMALALLFFIRRPFLNITKDAVSTRKFGSIQYVKAEDIKLITLQPGYVIIELKTKKSNWVFSRAFNRYDTAAMATALQIFAAGHGIPVEVKS